MAITISFDVTETDFATRKKTTRHVELRPIGSEKEARSTRLNLEKNDAVTNLVTDGEAEW